MKKKISFKLFLTVVWRGVCQVLKAIGKLFGYKEGTAFGKVVWRVFATCVTTLLLLLTVSLVYVFCNDVVYRKWIRPNTSPSVYMEEHLGNSIYFQDLYYRDGRVLDKENGKTLIDDVKWVAKTTDTLAVFAVDDKRGFLNRFTGEVVVPCIYDRAWVFAEGMAAVEKNGKLLFIDQLGNVVIDKGHIVPFETKGFFFRSGYCVVNNAIDGKLGLIDKTGNWVLAPEYELIGHPNDSLWVVKKNGYYGVLTETLDTLFAPELCGVVVHDNFIEARFDDHTAKLFDFKGKLVEDFVIDEVENMTYETTELRQMAIEDEGTVSGIEEPVNAVADCQKYGVNNEVLGWRYGLLDRKGKRVTPPVYTSIDAIGKDLYLCMPYGTIINGKGESVE